VKRTPLTRKTPLRRTRFKRSKKLARPSDSPTHLAIISSLPCHRCKKPGPSEAHHLRDFTGMAMRAPDRDAFPLCDRCHRSWLHNSGVSREERRAFQREAVAEYRLLFDMPVLLLVMVSDRRRWEVVGAYASEAEAERVSERMLSTRGQVAFWWWGEKSEAARMLADPQYQPEEKSA
jgi:hypothetical protein